MAKKISAPAGPAQPAPPIRGGERPRPSGPRRRWVLAALALGLAALALLAVQRWRQAGLGERVLAALPAPPDVTGRPAVLVEKLGNARKRAATPGEEIAGVAELGRLYQANGYNREAEACWRLLRIEQPNDARWVYFLADLRRMASDYTEMGSLLEQTTKVAPDYAPAWLKLAGLQFKTGQAEQAERNYRQRLKLVPGDPYARLWLARMALQGGREAEARTLIEQLVKDTPEFSSGHNLYAEMLAASGDTAGANRQRWLGRETGRFREADDPWLDELLAWCYDYEQLCALGTVELQTGRVEQAKSYYERAIRLRPGEATGYELLGAMYLKRNDPAKARETLEQSLPRLQNSKPSISFYLGLSQAYRDLKQPAEAVRVARQGLQQVGENLELLSTLGTAFGDLGQPDAAIAAFHQALALNPNDAETNFNLGLFLLARERPNEAIAALKRSLIQQPTFPKALTLLGRLELDAGRWESAEQYLRPLIESHPEIAEARQLMAFWYLRAGFAADAKKDPAAAERHYRAGLELNPKHAELQVSLGVLCLVQGRFKDALEPLEAYHRLLPQNPQGCLFLGQAYAANGRIDEARRVLADGIAIAEREGNAATAQHCREILQQL